MIDRHTPYTPNPIPFDLVECRWPRPVEQHNACWISQPEWDAPPMPFLPQPRWESIEGDLCWTLDWCDFFNGGLRGWDGHQRGEMRSFHVVFRIRVRAAGTLVFWDDDGSFVRRGGRLIHADRSLHAPMRHQIEVDAGDELEIAQWQAYGGWLWGARLHTSEPAAMRVEECLLPYRDAVLQALSHPNGPPLKLYGNGANPLRTLVSLYSMLLNGYRPAQILLFGEHQWPADALTLITTWLPSAQVVATQDVLERLRQLGQPRLASFARQHWFVMKACVALFYPPAEFCMMDDDLFVLDRVDQALDAFESHDLVFAADADYSDIYIGTWGRLCGRQRPLPTGTFNAGLYWMRNHKEPRQLAANAGRVPPQANMPLAWEQGLIAAAFAADPVYALPSSRYFYPFHDGLPGGVLGYDYATNPCGFASVHWGGLDAKPSDETTWLLARDLLDRQSARPEATTEGGVTDDLTTADWR